MEGKRRYEHSPVKMIKIAAMPLVTIKKRRISPKRIFAIDLSRAVVVL